MDDRSAFKSEVGGGGAVVEGLDDQTGADSIEVKFERIPSFTAAVVAVAVVAVAVVAFVAFVAAVAGAGAGRNGGSSGGMGPEGLEVNINA